MRKLVYIQIPLQFDTFFDEIILGILNFLLNLLGHHLAVCNFILD